LIWSKADYLSTIDTNRDLIRWFLSALASDQSCEINFQFMFMKVTWSKVDYLSTIGTNHGMVRRLLTALAPGQPWKQNHIEISCDWLYQNAGLTLTQSSLCRDYTASVLRVCSEGRFLGFNLDFLDVCHWGVRPTCQWKMIRWMTHQEIYFSWISWGSSISNEQQLAGYLYPCFTLKISFWD
jgi:hypothetical protein